MLKFKVHVNFANKHRFIPILLNESDDKDTYYTSHPNYAHFSYEYICDKLSIDVDVYEENAKQYEGKRSYNYDLDIYDIDFPTKKQCKRFIEEWLSLFLFFGS